MTEFKSSQRGEALGRILGPGEPELTCDECFEYLDRYVEAELAGKDAEAAVPGMGSHLQGCATCHEDRDSLLALIETETIADET